MSAKKKQIQTLTYEMDASGAVSSKPPVKGIVSAESVKPQPDGWDQFARAAKRRSVGPIMYLKPADLAPHPMLDRVTMRPDLMKLIGEHRNYKDEAGEEKLSWDAFCEDVARRGVREPVRVCKVKGKWLILDGRHRWLAGKAADLPTIPCIAEIEEDAREIILGAVTFRKRSTAASTAYLWILQHPYLAIDAKRGRPTKGKLSSGQLTREEVERASGVGHTTLEEAVATFKHLHAKPKERAHFEPLILSGLCDLGAARAGAAGSDNGGKGGSKSADCYAQSIKALDSITHWAKSFGKLSGPEKEELASAAEQRVAEWPSEFADMLRCALDEAKGGNK